MRRSTLLVVFMASLVGFGLFQLKYEVMKLENKCKQINNSLKNSKETISVLNAEWSHLISPDRLQRLAEKHLTDIGPVAGKQLISLRQAADEPQRDSYQEEVAFKENRMVLDQLVSNVLSDNND